LLNITGASVARCCVVPDEMLPARVNHSLLNLYVLSGWILKFPRAPRRSVSDPLDQGKSLALRLRGGLCSSDSSAR
jgi:hypothetical protein